MTSYHTNLRIGFQSKGWKLYVALQCMGNQWHREICELENWWKSIPTSFLVFLHIRPWWWHHEKLVEKFSPKYFYGDPVHECHQWCTLGTNRVVPVYWPLKASKGTPEKISKGMDCAPTTTTECRPVGRRGSRGFTRTPLLISKRFYIHRLTVHLVVELPLVQ